MFLLRAKSPYSRTPPLMVDKSDGLNNLTNTNTETAEQATQTTDSRDDYKNCMDLQYGFGWDLEVNPLTVEVQECMDKYIHQLMQMDFGDYPVVELENDFRGYIPIFAPQSGITADTTIEESTSDVTHQTMRFRDQYAGHNSEIESFTDPTRRLQDKDDVPLDKFFSRPQKIFEVQWNTNGIINADFNPWNLFLQNRRVANRLTNYKLLRCNLRMKVVVNGNGFQYGRAFVAYWPMAGYDNFGGHSTAPLDYVQTTQLPHIYVDPTTSSGGEMNIPFFWHQNYFDIPGSNWGGSLGIPDAGRVLLRTLTPLKHANGANDKVTISFFVWAEDVQLAIPTSVDGNTLQPQAGEEVDEANTKGMISGPATAVSKFAGIAAGYAPIAPYAMATSKVAGAVASAAKIMGYSRPTNTKNPEPLRPTPISQLATTTTPDTALKLTVDDKQELTIDPRISGVGAHDPLVIRDIAKRESYLTSFNWAVGADPATLLWNARVNPCLWQQDGTTGAIRLPACAIAALPFRYWNGSMKFRFQVVCSTFHKGRLEIRYDPSHVDPLSALEYNVNYIEVIDIAETQDFTIEVTNSQPFSLLRHLNPGLDSVTEGYSTTNYSASLAGLCNGVISVRILNELTVPNSTIDNDISVNVFISAGDDFEVFVPEDQISRFMFFPQSGVEVVPESQNTAEPSAPQQTQSDHMGADLQYSSELNMVFAGESIVSFRPLLKRYNLWRREPNSLEGNEDFWKISRRRLAYPFFRRGGPSDWIEGGPGGGYNFCNTVLLHWITNCFAGYRGSIRYKWLYTKSAGCAGGGNCCDDIGSRVYVERLDPETVANPAYFGIEQPMPILNAAQVSQGAMPGFDERTPTGVRGSVFATDLINPCLEFEVPYQTQFRFVPGKPARMTNTNALGANRFMNMYRVVYEGHVSREQQIDMHVAAGEDFQVYFWTGLPPVYYQSSPPQFDPPEPPEEPEEE